VRRRARNVRGTRGGHGVSSGVPDGWHSVTARLVAHDPEALVEFLRAAFDARGLLATDSPTQLRIGDSIVMVSGTGPRAPTASFFYLYVADADATYRNALAAGAQTIEEPLDTPYGDRRAMVRDPFGNEWQIATYRG
jgi:PhnB protein